GRVDERGVGKAGAEALSLCEASDGQVERRRQLGGPEWLEQIAHHASSARPPHERVVRATGEEDDGAASADGRSGGFDPVAVGEPDRKDPDVRLGAPDEGPAVRATYGLASHFTPRGPDRRAQRSARALMIIDDGDAPARGLAHARLQGKADARPSHREISGLAETSCPVDQHTASAAALSGIHLRVVAMLRDHQRDKRSDGNMTAKLPTGGG